MDTAHIEGSKMNEYQHDSIDLHRPTFRLLRLCQGRGIEINCEIFQASFDDFDLIDYEALSYTWGNKSVTQAIHVNGRTLEVTQNLYCALKYLRSPTIDRILWIDAICINQENNEERGHQVKQMGSIYSKAVKVIFWLGLETDETDILMDSLKHLEKRSLQHACKNWPPGDERWNNLWSSLSDEPEYQHLDKPSQQRQGLITLLDRPWFKRVWILQEVANARKATVCCGYKSISARIFALAPSLLDVYPRAHCRAVLEIMPGMASESSWWHQKRNLYTLLVKFGNSEASDSRDMIYALLGISSDGDGLQADYKKAEREVIQDTILFVFGVSDFICDSMSGFLKSFSSLNTTFLNQHVSSEGAEWVSEFLSKRGDLVNITQDTLAAAAKNVSHGVRVTKLLLDSVRSKLRGNDAAPLEAAAENTGCGLEIMRLLLQQDFNREPVTTHIVEKAVRNPRFSLDLLKFLTKTRPLHSCCDTRVLEGVADDTENGPEMMEFLMMKDDSWVWNLAGGCHPMVLLLLIQIRGEISVPLKDIARAAAINGSHGPQVVELLLEQTNYGDAVITNFIINQATQNKASGDKIIQLLIERRPQDIDITANTLKLVAEGNEASTLKLLLENKQSDVKVTEKMIWAAAKNFKDPDTMMRLLFDHYETSNKIDAKLAGHIARLKEPATMAHLLEKMGDNVEITEKVVESAGRNLKYSKEMVGVLIRHRAASLDITPKLIGYLAANSEPLPMRSLLDQSDQKYTFTEEILEKASIQAIDGAGAVSVLLEHSKGHVPITENTLKAAACNPHCGDELIRCFLQLRRDEFVATEEVLKAVASHGAVRDGVMDLLLESRGKDVRITETIAEAAAGNIVHAKDLMQLFIEREEDFLVTDRVVRAALKSGPAGRQAIELLLRKTPTKFRITEEALMHFAEYEHPRLIRLILQQWGDNVQVTKNLMEAAARNEVYSETVAETLLKHQEKSL